jgi:hypothetical protein
MKKFLKYTLFAILALVAVVGIYLASLNQKEPQSQVGEDAELMARHLLYAVNKPAWDSTAWIKWTYAKRNSYIWDKQNGKVQVNMSGTKVLLDIATQKALSATQDGAPLSGEAAEKARQDAWKWFCNDSFWLNAPVKIMDEGTQRSLVTLKNGKKALKVKYTNGGVTPGDTYLWTLDDQFLPTEFEMWVQIIPIGGVRGTWENWVTLSTGAKIATKHKIGGLLSVEVTDLEAGVGEVSW